MKAMNFMAAGALALGLAFASVNADAQTSSVRNMQGGPGIVVAASQNYNKLPKQAQSFLNRHFKGANVVKCEQYFTKNRYEVELSNGVDVEFDNNGKIVEIDAPDNQCLPAAAVKEVLHKRAYDRLVKDGLANKVESVEFNKRGKACEIEFSIPEPDLYIFDIDGNFIAIAD